MSCYLKHKEAINNLKSDIIDSGYKQISLGRYFNQNAFLEHNKKVEIEAKKIKTVVDKWNNSINKLGITGSVVKSIIREYQGDIDSTVGISRNIIDIVYNEDILNKIDNFRKSLGIYDSKLSYFSYIEEQKKSQNTLFQLNNNSSNQSLQEGLQWLKKVNPNVQPEIVQGLIDGIANGSYNSNLDLITLSEEFANKATVKHEMLHLLMQSLPFEQREAILNEASKKYGIARGESKTTTKYSQIQQNEINYALKAVDILQSDKAKQIFEKGKKANWDLNKILTELQIPKEQKQLILDLGITDREQIALELASNYSYSVEINTSLREINENQHYLSIEDQKELINEAFDNQEISEKEYLDAIQNLKEIVPETVPTKHYSNLTVAGGTNYTENEISTPLITPSIKGHAQFATNKGIGWFRSDDSTNTNNTRRILELQSDLFQKGRDRDNLVSEKAKYINTSFNEKFNVQQNELKSNQFLQLLNKDNNWVTFFTKSIIQDSAKKGYEKVLFPRLDTIIQIESDSKWKTYEDAEKAMKDARWQGIDQEYRQVLQEQQEEYSKNPTEKLKKSIVESKERIASHQPSLLNTAKFYENDLANKLDDIAGGNKNDRAKGIWSLNQITDEFGNTWNEINLSSEKVKQQTNKILFQSPKLQYTGDLAIEEKIAEEAENSKDETVAKTPLQKFIQSIRNLLRNIFKEKDKVSRLLRNMNQGRLNSNNRNNNSQGIKYQLSKEQSDAIDNVFDENPELANTIYEVLGFKQKQYASKLKQILERRKLATKIDLENSQLIKDIRVDKSQPKELKPNEADKNLVSIMLYGQRYNDLSDTKSSEEDFEGSKSYKQSQSKVLAYRILNDLMFDLEELDKFIDEIKDYPEYASSLTTNENPVKEFFENDIFEQVEKDVLEITPQQKQQAKEVYQQYINSLLTGETISNQAGDLSKSKVKDIVYHGSKNKFEKFDKSKLGSNTNPNKEFHQFNDSYLGFHFTSNPEYYKGRHEFGSKYENNLNEYSVLININNPKKLEKNNPFADLTVENITKKDVIDNDSVIYDYLSRVDFRSGSKVNIFENNYIVFEPSQIHIMGSKSDIEQAKGFISNQNQNTTYYQNNSSQSTQQLEERIAKTSLKDILNTDNNIIDKTKKCR